MSTINTESLVDNLKESLDLRPEDSGTYLRYLLKQVVIDISRKFSTLFHEAVTVNSDSNGIVELPADTYRIISVQFGEREAMPISFRQYHIYTGRDISFSTEVFAAAKQYPNKVDLMLVPKQSYTDVKVIYQTYNNGAGNITIDYEPVLFWGVRAKYLATKRDLDVDNIGYAQGLYTAELDKLQYDQNAMYPSERVQYYWERNWEHNFNFNFMDGTRDVAY